MLQSFEVNPLNDFSGSGKPDDGPPDLIYGQNYDLISAGSLDRFSWVSGLAYGEQAGIGYVFATGGTNPSRQKADSVAFREQDNR